MISYHDYPFGMQMQKRSVVNTGAEYRFGFNGKENDTELYGGQNSINFGERIYNAKLSRWLSTDKFESHYPSISAYHFAGNNPIAFVDPDGNEIRIRYMTDEQWVAFSTIISARFGGFVDVTKTQVEKSYKTYNVETRKVEDAKLIYDKITFSINEEKLEAQIKKENPDITPDLLAQKTEEMKKEIEAEYAYGYLNKLANSTSDHANFSLMDGFEIADFESRVINASSIAKTGDIQFSVLFHEIAEQANGRARLKIPGFADGYGSSHWDAYIQQAKDLGVDMVLTSIDRDYDTNDPMTWIYMTTYESIKKSGIVTGYKKTVYRFVTNNKEVTSKAAVVSTTTINVNQYNKDISDAKESFEEK